MAEVLTIPRQPDGQPYYSTSPLRRSPMSSPSFLAGSPPIHSTQSPRKPAYPPISIEIPTLVPSTAPSSPLSTNAELSSPHSFTKTSPTSLYIDTKLDGDLAFPSYGTTYYKRRDAQIDTPPSPKTSNSSSASTFAESSPSEPSRTSSPDHTPVAEDDTAVREEPSQQVDYLSHDWREEDVWLSWRHLVSKRKSYGEQSRLENACWRSWAKSKYNLKTVSPETLNWLKDCDVTWLYGPLQTNGERRTCGCNASEPTSQLSKNNSFVNKKPILKKRSMSEVMLQRSISASSLVKQAAAAVQAQQRCKVDGERTRDRPLIGRTASEVTVSSLLSRTTSKGASEIPSQSSSGFVSPDSKDRRHIRFDDKVEQCIAVDIKEGDDEEEDDRWAHNVEEESSDDGLCMRKTPSHELRPQRKSSRSNSNSDGRTIAKLPCTTLKYRVDSPDPQTPQSRTTSNNRFSTKLSPSPSQETLRPSGNSTNFLLAEDDDDDMSWEPSGAFAYRRDSVAVTKDRASELSISESKEDNSGGLRRTPSGMFMPYEEDEDDVVAVGLFGRVVDTVNTARDIAHVIWNVGWRK